MTDVVDWKGKKGQRGTSSLSSRFFRRVNCGFQVKKILNWQQNRQKASNFPIFKSFMQLLGNFDRLRGLKC